MADYCAAVIFGGRIAVTIERRFSREDRAWRMARLVAGRLGDCVPAVRQEIDGKTVWIVDERDCIVDEEG